MNYKTGITALFTGLILTTAANAKVVEYNFDIAYKTVNKSGLKEVQAMTVGGSTPAPTIEATVGDTLRVTFNNKMDVQSSIHWHGVLLPNDQDGVPYLNTPPIQPGTTFTYEYPVIHSGTYWYHSHTGLQEQRGVYGSIIFNPKNGERVKTNRDEVVVFSDWTDENPDKVIANLKKDGDYYALKKDSVQSWWGALSNGWEGIKNRLIGAQIRMGPMDLSDVGYDAFLTNGKKETFIEAAPGETLRLRLINAAASSYFYVEFAGAPMTIVSADGVDVQPRQVKRLRMAVAETYDVVVKIPHAKRYELRATSEDGAGYSSTYIGTKGAKIASAPSIESPNLYLADHSMHGMHGGGDSTMKMEEKPSAKMNHSMHGNMKHKMHNMKKSSKVVANMEDYTPLKAVHKTVFDANKPVRTVPLTLTGNMERYVWSFDNKTLTESDKILIKKGEVVRMVFKNETMMHHPLHLHGHFFRVLNGQGDYSPLKHTVNVPPLGSVTIEFEANEEKDWIFHCHNLYHMKSGMTRILTYNEDATLPKSLSTKLSADRKWYFMGNVSALSHMALGTLRTSNTRNALEVKFDYGYASRGYETTALYKRAITRFLDVYAGGRFEREDKHELPENKGIVGISYVLPMLIESDITVDDEGDVRLELESELQLTDRTELEWQWEHNFETKTNEYRLGISYEINKTLSLTANHDSDFNTGVGLRVKF